VFTNEMDFDETIITILDDEGQYEDIGIFMDETEVYIRQFDPTEDSYDFVVMSAPMFYELLESMKQPEGAYISNRKVKSV
tara:strand:+ start:3726 stop:3965 length:240 start_codon:yes stop_codon:yes gene_type:complete